MRLCKRRHQLNANATEVNANRALLALLQGNNAEAQSYLAKATTAQNYNELAGLLQLSAGSYAGSASTLQGNKSNAAALAQILNKDYAAALTTLKSVSQPDGLTSYLKAIVAARSGRDAEVISNLKTAFAADPSLKQRAATDLEFVNLFNDSSFTSLVK